MEERDQVHVEQHGEGDVNVEVPKEQDNDDAQQDDQGSSNDS